MDQNSTSCCRSQRKLDAKTGFWTDRHPGTTHFQALFEHAHLPPHLAAVSAPFALLADDMVAALPDGPELSAGLRKLVEAKDCFVRAAVLASKD
jgi:hypothetical protein